MNSVDSNQSNEISAIILLTAILDQSLPDRGVFPEFKLNDDNNE